MVFFGGHGILSMGHFAKPNGVAAIKVQSSATLALSSPVSMTGEQGRLSSFLQEEVAK